VLKKAVPALVLLLSIGGLFLAMSLTGKHFDLNHATTEETTSVLGFAGLRCGEDGGCGEVNKSKYSKISLGAGRAPMPVSILAVGFFFMLAFLAGRSLGGGPRRRKDYMALVVAFSAPAIAFSLYLLAVQAFVIGEYCPYCLGIDAITITSALLAYIDHGGGISGIIEDLKTRPRVPALVCIAAMLFMDYQAYGMYTRWIDAADGQFAGSHEDSAEKHDRNGASQADPEADEKALAEARKAVGEFLAAYPAIEVMEVPTNPFDGTKGALDDGILITEFADFECPHCKLAAFYLKDIAHRYGDRVGFVFKNYPLGTSCNENLKRDVHPDACEAAVGVQCAKRQAAFWLFHDVTFDHQGDLGGDRLLSIANQLKLDRNTFAQCLENEAVWEEVRTQVEQGRAAGLNGTPTFFVNGKQLPSAHPLFVEAAIRYELSERGAVSLPEDPDGIFPL